MGHTQYTLQHGTTNTNTQCNEEQQIHNTHYNVEQQIQINNTMKNNKYRSHINTNRNVHKMWKQIQILGGTPGKHVGTYYNGWMLVADIFHMHINLAICMRLWTV